MDQPITRAEHISIHALCEEGDSRVYPHPAVIIYFYPRPLRGGRRAKAAIEDADEIFLSTPSARRATHELDHGQRAQVISIHALCEEGDALCCRRRPEEHENFYPRPLRGGRLKPSCFQPSKV